MCNCRKALKTLLYLVAGALTLSALGIGFLFTDPGKTILARVVEKISNRSLHGRLVIGSIRGNLLTHLDVRDLELFDANNRLALKISRLEAQYRLHPLESTKVFVEEAVLSRPEAFMHVDAEGNNNWSGLLVKKNASGGDLVVWGRNLRIEGGTFEFSSPKPTNVIKLDLIELVAILPPRFNHIPQMSIVVSGWKDATKRIPIHLNANVKGESNTLSGSFGSDTADVVLNGNVDLQNIFQSVFSANFKVVHDQKWIVEGALTKNTLAPRLTVHKLRVEGKCPLLVLTRPASLTFVDVKKLPIGKIDMLGCAGEIAYENKLSEGLTLDFKYLQLGRILNEFKIVLPQLGGNEIKLEAHVAGGGEGAKVTAQVSVNDADAPLSLQADLRIPPSLDWKQVFARWTLQLNGLDLTKLAQFKKLDQMKNMFFGSIKASGEGFLLNQKADARVWIESRKNDQNKNFVEINAHIENRRIEGVLVSKKTQLDAFLALVAPLYVATDQGLLDADLHLVADLGQLEKLTYRGYATVAAKTLQVSIIPARYQALVLELAGDNHRIVLKKLEAKGGSGVFAATGDLTFGGASHSGKAAIVGSFKDFMAYTDEKIRATLSGDLDLSFALGNFEFGGEARISAAELKIPDKSTKKNIEPLFSLEDVTEKPDEPPSGSESKPKFVSGEFKIDAPQNVWVKGSDMQIELSAALTVGIHKDFRSFITGEVRALHGQAAFLGHQFDIRQALVQFTGDPNTPNLTLDAFYPSSPYSIHVGVNGNLPKIEPRLSSEPMGLSQEECANVLLTGSADSQKKAGGGSSAPDATNLAMGAASGYAVSAIKKELGATIPIDTLTIQTASQNVYSSSRDETNQQKIEVGKYVSDRIFIKAGRSYNPGINAQENRASVDYRLSNRWSIEAMRTDSGRSDLGFVWTLNY